MEIKQFSEILPIKKQTIIALDIDETILYYDSIDSKWWSNSFKKYWELSKDYDTADKESHNEWVEYIKNKEPNHTDKEGLDLLIKSDAKIIFVTARNSIMRDITKYHMSKLGIENPDIIFCAHADKGILLEKWINNNNYDDHNLIFIDDKHSNITDVKTKIPHAICYQFKFGPL